MFLLCMPPACDLYSLRFKLSGQEFMVQRPSEGINICSVLQAISKPSRYEFIELKTKQILWDCKYILLLSFSFCSVLRKSGKRYK
jgi:hypothetical protein